ncbi:hybrid sensor histidine kinase/response regulator [Pseudophaeobacter flagellatus]|uniref:hybrid sensor histidine kinase/response regulator n=1 Tax=Pseudophaeobacter flagellatus TaxID=2899119 RepID=UPI001E2DC5CE|nr:histidine kinase N-terminal 7TM domain-containing protein [Pseudophaeobacter flagellatus]MCD9149601.1 ATP-binding protein [Pseudophaeobacter flagellatus]
MTCLTNLDVNLASGSAAVLWVVCFFVMVAVARNNPFGGQPAFVLTLAAMLWWLFTVGLDLASPSEACKIGWSLAAWPGIILLPIAWTFFIFDYTLNTTQERHPIRLLAYIGLPGLVSVIALTNSRTQLLYGPDTHLVVEEGSHFVVFDHGPLFYLIAFCLYLFIMATLGLLCLALLKSKRVIRPFLSALFIVTAAPVAANLAYIGWGVTLFGFDPTPYTFAVSLIALSWLLLNNSMMDTAAQGQALIFSATHDPVLLVDGRGRLADVNPAARALFGLHLPGLGDRIDRLPGIGPLIEELIHTKVPYAAEPIRIGHRIFDPRALPIESPIQTTTSLLGWSVSLVDITERERTAEALRAALAQAEAANRAKTHFLANVSHEIRTPLNGVLGMATVLSETKLDEEQKDYLQAIEDSGRVLLSTIGDVLDLSKIEAGKMELENKPFLLRDAVNGACNLFAGVAKEKSLRLSVMVDPDLPQTIVADEYRLRQVLHNLVSNAVKFTREGGVTIIAEPTEGGTLLLLRVCDTGPGVPTAARDAIFEPFQQADGSDARKFGGTGLGLSISRQLCQAMGGSLQLAAETEQGETFEIRLPLQSGADLVTGASLDAVALPLGSDLPALAVLVVDDNKTNRLILQKFLASTACRVATAASGGEALDLVSRSVFDVILMDIQMPEMDGVEATQKIRSVEQAKERDPSFIVAVTANAMPKQMAYYRDMHMDDVLAKPVSKPQLLALMQGVRRRAVQA